MTVQVAMLERPVSQRQVPAFTQCDARQRYFTTIADQVVPRLDDATLL
jgi:hypothetical protein